MKTNKIDIGDKIGYLNKYGRYSYCTVEAIGIPHPKTGNEACMLRQKFRGYNDNIFYDEVENIYKWLNEKSADYHNKYLLKLKKQ